MDKEKDVTEQPDPPFSKDDLLGAEGESDFPEEQQTTPTEEQKQEEDTKPASKQT